MGPVNPTGSKEGRNVEIYLDLLFVNAGMVLYSAHSSVWSVVSGHLTEGGGEAWAGQLRLYLEEAEMEKSPRFLESEENLGALNPIGSILETIKTGLV